MKEFDFPKNTLFYIKEFDIPLAYIPGEGWFNFFGGKPRKYDVRGLKVDNNWPAESFREWAGILDDSMK